MGHVWWRVEVGRPTREAAQHVLAPPSPVDALDASRARGEEVREERWSARPPPSFPQRFATDCKGALRASGFFSIFSHGKGRVLSRSACCAASRRPAAMPSGFGTSAPASWFQVNCPSCTAALQVRLAEGSWPVACSQVLRCKAIFTVKVHASMLKTPEAPPVASKRHTVRVAQAVHTYNLFIKIEAKRLRTLDRTLTAAHAWTLAAAGWAASQMNPKNAPAVVTATATPYGRCGSSSSGSDGGTSGCTGYSCCSYCGRGGD